MKHGGNLRAACSAYGHHQFLDFSANINPLGIPKQIQDIWLQNIDAVTHYPDPDCELLCGAIAQLEQIPETSILCGNGSSELLFLAVEVKQPKRVLLLAPCFAEYEQAARRVGAEVIWYHLEQTQNFQWTVNDMPLDHIDMIIIGNPNNPTSQCASIELMNDLIQQCKIRNIELLVDEAFIDLVLDKPTIIDHAVMNEHLLVLRAFTKSLAMPGVRIGYAIAGSSWLDEMKKKQIPWSVNVFAQDIAQALPNLTDYKNKTRQWLIEELPYMYQSMRQFSGLDPIAPSTNFILWNAQKNGLQLKEYLAQEHYILIRDCSNYNGLEEGWFRTAIRLREENDRLVQAIEMFLEVSTLE